ncbi:MAG: NAD(P)-dependent oxidoreductase [Spiroplasma sp.]|nr:NAD(P)-dependent oxidoreductase [Spiroplasma sp.]
MKVICYGVRETDQEFFHELNKKYKYQLILKPELLTHENITTAKGCDAVILRANCIADQKNLDQLKSYGVKYLLTRTVGFNHIDIAYAKSLGFLMARVPSYSPNAVSELAVALAVGLLRNTFYVANNSANRNFKIDNFIFAKEIRNSTIGVIGTGRIGFEFAKAFKGMGAKILGYDIYPNKNNETILQYTDLDTLLKTSDLISLHTPYMPGENDKMVNQKFLNKMKDGSFLINAARGELIDHEALYQALISNKLKGAALDTITQESEIFFKDFKNTKLPIPIFEKLNALSPRVIISPHIGSYTDEATKNMIEISYKNLDDFIKNLDCPNKL